MGVCLYFMLRRMQAYDLAKWTIWPVADYNSLGYIELGSAEFALACKLQTGLYREPVMNAMELVFKERNI